MQPSVLELKLSCQLMLPCSCTSCGGGSALGSGDGVESRCCPDSTLDCRHDPHKLHHGWEFCSSSAQKNKRSIAEQSTVRCTVSSRQGKLKDSGRSELGGYGV